MGLRIAVCLKWVSTRPEVDSLTGATETDPRFSGASPADLSALEWAFRLAQAAGTVTAITVGDISSEAMLRDAVAAGANDAIRVSATPGGSSEAVAADIATVCADHELIVCGDHSLDRGSGSVPAFIAHQLGWAQALGLLSAANQTGADDDPWPLLVERRLDRGRRERLQIASKAVISFETGPELRRASLASTLAARTVALDVHPSTGASRPQAPHLLETGPFRPRARVKAAPSGDTRERVLDLIGGATESSGGQKHEVSPDEGADIVVAQLRQWGYIDPNNEG